MTGPAMFGPNDTSGGAPARPSSSWKARILRRAPAEPAMLLRPLAGDPAARAEPLQPGVVLVPLEMLAARLLAPHFGRQLLLAEGANLGAEGVERRVAFDRPDEHGALPDVSCVSGRTVERERAHCNRERDGHCRYVHCSKRKTGRGGRAARSLKAMQPFGRCRSRLAVDQLAVMPPSMTSSLPVTQAASSEAR